MPSPTFTIEYKTGDFFYNTVNTGQNVPLLATFPFTKESLMKWANDIAHLDPPIRSVDDIFDPQISRIVLNPDYDFQNTFLPGNITAFNNNFDKLTLDLTNPPQSEATDNHKPITGTIHLMPNNGTKETVLDITPKDSQINWKEDGMKSWQSDFNLNANMFDTTTKLSQEIPFTDIDGGESTIIMTTNNPRCKYRKTCTMKHWYYSQGCTTQVTKDSLGNTSCRCQCKGGATLGKGEEHSHCESYSINPDGTASTKLGKEAAPVGLGLMSLVKSIRMKLNAPFPQYSFGAPGGNVELPYKDHDELVKNDAKIRKLIYEYYYELSENIRLQKSIQERGSKDVTSKQSLLDATVQYKKEYLNVFNIAIGIVGVAGYIYIMGKAALEGKTSALSPNTLLPESVGKSRNSLSA